MQISRQ